MTAYELAQRLSALDWSMTPLQNQLAVAAAISSLNLESPERKSNANVDRTDSNTLATAVAGRHVRSDGGVDDVGNKSVGAGLPIHSNVVALCPPTRPLPKPRTVRILHLDGREFASAGFLPGLASAPWEWIVETVAAECECRPEQVGCMEPPEDDEGPGRDFITVDGLPCYRVGFGAASTPRE